MGAASELHGLLGEAASMLERILVEAVLPFWRARAVDRERGGYHLHHDRSGRDLGPASRHVIGQTRTLWFFSRLARSAWVEPGDLEAARHGFEFLMSRQWDQRHGGFAWEVLADGEPFRPHKHALAQASAVLALAEYWKASGDDRALDLARQTFAEWDHAAHDPVHGGYVEMHRSDWSPATGLEGYWAHDPSLRMLDTHLHIAEGLAALHRVAPAPELAARIRELLAIVTAADSGCSQGATAFGSDWTPLPRQRVEYGFDVKRIALTTRICTAVGIREDEHLELHRRLFATVMRYAWDRRDGGLFEAGRPGRPAHELVKSWWTQAEALVASLLMWRLTGDQRYAAVFLRTLDWVVGWQVDWINGEWFELVDRRRRPSGRKAWAWKAPFHGPRAILDSLEMLGVAARRDRELDRAARGAENRPSSAYTRCGAWTSRS